MELPWIILAIIILLAIIGIAVLAISKKKEHKPDYYTFFVMGIIWLGAGIPLEMYPLSAMGLIFMITGLIHKDKWKKNHLTWDKMTEAEKRNKMILIGLLLLLVVAGVAAFFLVASKN